LLERRGGEYDPRVRTRIERAMRGAGLDVFSREPVSPDDPLLELSTLVVTPHLAWLTTETLERSLGVIAENSRRLRTGEALLHRVV
jgi:phosphoglycerate dehydrogenase-like enzyme